MKFYFLFLFISKTHFELVEFKFKYIRTFPKPAERTSLPRTQQLPYQPLDWIRFFYSTAFSHSFIHYARLKPNYYYGNEWVSTGMPSIYVCMCTVHQNNAKFEQNIHMRNSRRRAWHEKALKWLTKTKTCYYGVRLHADHGAVTTTKTEL